MKFIKSLIPYLVIITVVVVIRTFIATPVRVDGSSMVPTLKNNDILILNKLARNYKRFDIVVVRAHGAKLVKRIIGLPGESIEYKNNKLYINGKVVEDVTPEKTDDFSLEKLYGMKKIPAGYYFVMGDNRDGSSDSRDYRIGLIKKDDIIGKTIIRIFPFTKIKFL
ncbi:MAG: signal peptidase I [Bacilli bacterium]|nr:signal peptidase I [Bacilli bacterium]